MANTCALRFVLQSCTVTNASTPGQPDGTIVVSALDPNSVATIRYNLNSDFTYPSGGQTSTTFSSLVPGTYTIYARNSTSCRATITLTVGFTSNYSIRHRIEYNDLGTTSATKKWRFDILDNQYIGPINYEEGAGMEPVVPSWRGEGSEDIFEASVISSEVSVSLNSPTDQYFIHLYTFDETRFKGKMYLHNGTSYDLFWEGYLTPMLYSEPYVSKTNYDVNLIFTDRLADLKEYDFSDNDGNIPQAPVPVMNAVLYCLQKTKLELYIWESVNFYANGMLYGTNDSTLEQMYIDSRVYINDDGTTQDCLTVLKALMEFMGCRIYQSNGRWNIDLITQKTASLVPTRIRTSLLQVSPGGDKQPRKLLRRINQPAPKVVFTDGQQVMSIPQTYGTINLTYNLGIINNLLTNGNFEIEDLANGQFKGWYADMGNATYATIGLEKLQEPRGTSQYAFYAQFDSTQLEDYILLTSAPTAMAAVAADYKLKISFDVYTRPVFTNTYIWLDVAVSIDGVYLKPSAGLSGQNEFDGTAYGLVDFKYMRYYIDEHTKWNTISFDAFVAAADTISGDLVIEFRISSNQVYDHTNLTDLKNDYPEGLVYDVRRRVRRTISGVNVISFYKFEHNPSISEISPDIIRIYNTLTSSNTAYVWRLEKTVTYPKDVNNTSYNSWLQSLLIDNVRIEYLPSEAEPQEEITISEYPNPGVRQTLNKTVLHGDADAVDDNYRYVSKGLLSDSNGDPITGNWQRRGVSEQRTQSELLAKMIRGQYQELRWKLTGKLYMPDSPLTFWNTLHETRTGKVYQFMALTLYPRAREADFEAIETLSGATVVDESVPTDIIPAIEPPVADRIRFTAAGLTLNSGGIQLTLNEPAVTTYNIYVNYTIGISGASWQVRFKNNNGVTKQWTLGFGSGTTTTRTIAYFNNTMLVECAKQNNGGLAEDTVNIYVYKAGTPDVLLDSATFSVTDNVSLVQFNLTGLSAGDTIFVDLSEN